MQTNMQVSSINFSGHHGKRRKSFTDNAFDVAAATAVGAAGGYAVGRYALPVSESQLGFKYLTKIGESINEELKDTYSKELDALKKSPSANKEKIENFDYEFGRKWLKDLLNLSQDKADSYYLKHEAKVADKFGGTDKLIKTIKADLAHYTGKKFALYGALAFATAALIDKAFTSNRKH